MSAVLDEERSHPLDSWQTFRLHYLLTSRPALLRKWLEVSAAGSEDAAVFICFVRVTELRVGVTYGRI